MVLKTQQVGMLASRQSRLGAHTFRASRITELRIGRACPFVAMHATEAVVRAVASPFCVEARHACRSRGRVHRNQWTRWKQRQVLERRVPPGDRGFERLPGAAMAGLAETSRRPAGLAPKVHHPSDAPGAVQYVGDVLKFVDAQARISKLFRLGRVRKASVLVDQRANGWYGRVFRRRLSPHSDAPSFVQVHPVELTTPEPGSNKHMKRRIEAVIRACPEPNRGRCGPFSECAASPTGQGATGAGAVAAMDSFPSSIAA